MENYIRQLQGAKKVGGKRGDLGCCSSFLLMATHVQSDSRQSRQSCCLEKCSRPFECHEAIQCEASVVWEVRDELDERRGDHSELSNVGSFSRVVRIRLNVSCGS